MDTGRTDMGDAPVDVMRAQAQAAGFQAMLLDQVNDAVICHRTDGQVIYANEAACRERGYTRDEFLAMSLADLITENRRQHIARIIDDLHRGGMVVFESEDVAKDGHVIPVEVSSRLVDLAGESVVVSVVRDISERRQAQAEIEHLAYYDTLTGLPNRRLFMDRLTMALAHARRTGERLAVAFLDLDHLKRVNDQLGHTSGDLLLTLVGERLARIMRAGDTVAHLSGDEFVVLMPGVRCTEDADRVARKLLVALREPFDLHGTVVYETASVGIALNDPPEIDAAELLARADSAMYEVKNGSRNGYAIYSTAVRAATLEGYDLETELATALTEGQLRVFYQPQVSLETGRIVCVEALVRWQHPVRGMLEPARFLPIAEETGLVVPLGDFVIRQACAQYRAWVDEGLPRVRVAVNVSLRQLAMPSFTSLVTSALADAAMPPHDLELEVSEMDAIRADERARRTLQAVRELGVRVAVDDFGHGYTAGGHLHGLPVDTLKVKRCPPRVADDDVTSRVAESVRLLAEALALDTVVECVETEEQLEALRDRCCTGAQGYVFSRPVPAEELAGVLRNGYARP